MEARRAKAEYCGTVVGCEHRSCVRAVRRAELRAAESMVMQIKGNLGVEKKYWGITKKVCWSNAQF